jgi:hypothetical protein
MHIPEKEDRRWIIAAAFVLLSLTSIPYLIGYFRQGVDWRFTGFILGVEDGNSYIAKMLSGTYGNWLFKSPYSVMPQQGVLAFLPYILIGKLAYPPEIHDQLVVLFQIFRWVSGGLLIWSVYQFVGFFLIDRKLKKFAVMVIVAGGGLGWLGWMLLPGKGAWNLPLEVYSPEAFGFLSLLGLPHLAAARAFLLFGFIYFLRSCENESWLRPAVLGGVCWFVVGFFQPLTIAVGYGILACNVLIFFASTKENKWSSTLGIIKKTALLVAISSPWVIYNLFFFSADSYLKAWYAQNIISSPPIQDYLWSYGLFLVASIPAIRLILKSNDQRGLLLIAWLLCAALLAYFPYNVQRRFIEGIWIALVLLLFQSFNSIRQKQVIWSYRLILSTTAAAPLLVLLVVTQGVLTTAAPVYRPAKEVAMFDSISIIVKPNDIVLASYETGNAIPAWAPVFVLAGHGPESAHLKEVLPEVLAFFSGDKEMTWQKGFLSRNGVDYIIAGPNEKALGAWDKMYAGMFMKVYDQGEYQVYKVETLDGK